jgi:hypothetical protein
MELFQYEVHPNWQEYDRQVISSHNTLWRAAQIVAIVSTLLIYIASVAILPWPWDTALQICFSSGLFLFFALWTVHRESRWGNLTALVIGALLLTASVITAVAKPVITAEGESQAAAWPVYAAGLSVLICWAVCFWSLRRRPLEMRLVGFNTERWPLQILLGLATGGSLGLHFLLTTNQWFNWTLERVSPPYSLWTLLYLLGLGALGEEFFLRGVAYRLVCEESRDSFWKAAFQISLINLVIYLVPIYYIANGVSIWLGLWIMLYRLAYSLTVTFLRQQQCSLQACVAGNLVFNTILMVFFPW